MIPPPRDVDDMAQPDSTGPLVVAAALVLTHPCVPREGVLREQAEAPFVTNCRLLPIQVRDFYAGGPH